MELMKNKITFFKTALILFFVFFSNLKNIYAETSLYEIQGEKITYTDNLIVADGDARAKDQSGKEIFAKKIIYNKKDANIKTEGKSIYVDNKGNKLYADNFYYDIKLQIIDAKKNVKYLDKIGNVLNFTSLKYYETEEKGLGQNLKAKLTDKSSMEGLEAEFDNKLGTITLLKKNSYTACENKESSSKTISEICPDWSFNTGKTTHDKNEKMVYHRNALIKIKNIPVFYTPYFSHPDPSVKRKSGFLPPSVKNFTDLGQTVKAPYFWAIDENKDLTFTPIYYFDENSIFLSEYRQENKKSIFYIDSSYTQGYKDLNKKDKDGNSLQRTGGSRHHLFFNFLGSYEDLLFSQNDLEINIQRISQKNYLQVNQINTDHVKQDVTSLNNSVLLNSYKGSQRVKIESNIYENINIENTSEKYQYTLPSIEYTDYFRKFNQFVNISTSFSAKNLGGNKNQSAQNNELRTESDMRLFDALDGWGNIFKTSFNNKNLYNENISDNKDYLNSDTYLTLGVESSYPLIKVNQKFEQTITPKVFSKASAGSSAYASANLSTYDDLFALNQNPLNSTSFGYGVAYAISDKNIQNQIYFNGDFSIGQLFHQKKMNENTAENILHEKTSDFVGRASLFYDGAMKEKAIETEQLSSIKNVPAPIIKNGVNITYDYILSNDLNKILKNNLNASFSNKKNEFSSNYYETHDYIGDEHYAEFRYARKFDNNMNILFGVKKNIQASFTESNFVETNYESDCLKIGLSLAKTFYENKDLKASNNLTFSITLKPFGAPISPDLSSFLN